MSLKSLFILIASVFFLSCKSSKNENPFEHLSSEEREKLATFYHNISITEHHVKFQTGRLHRVYKDSALMAVPDHVEYMQRASYSYKKSGEHIKAMQMLNKAVALDVEKNSTKALEYKAWSMLYFYRDYESTIKDVDLIEKINFPKKYNACHGEPCLFLKGQAYYQLGEYQNAIETFEYLLKILEEKGLDPKDEFLTNFYLARSYFKSNNLDKSLFYLEEQLEMPYTVKAELNFYAGQIYVLKNEKEKALQHFLEAKELFLKNDKFYEPYIERFDEIFIDDIESEITGLN